MAGKHTILYDDRCAFCKRCVRWLILRDKHHRLRSTPIESPEGERLLAGMPLDERGASWHLVTPEGRVLSGGAAIPAVLRLLPRGRRVANLLACFPGATEAGYRLVARYRTTLGRLTRGQRCVTCD